MASLRQPLDLRAHVVEELAARLLVELLVLEQLEEAAEREERRAQLVRGLRDELLARVVEPRELALHVVEGGAELAELVVGVGLDAVGEVAGRDLARGALEPLDAQRQRARHEVAAEHARSGTRSRRRRGSGARISDTLSCTSPSASANTATPRTVAVLDQRLGRERLAAEPRRLGRRAPCAGWRARPGRPTARRRSRRRRRSESASTNSESSVPLTTPSTLTSALARVATSRPGASSCRLRRVGADELAQRSAT